jgi:hypothetical protein
LHLRERHTVVEAQELHLMTFLAEVLHLHHRHSGVNATARTKAVFHRFDSKD